MWHLQLCGGLPLVSLVIMGTVWCNLRSGATATLQVSLFTLGTLKQLSQASSQPHITFHNRGMIILNLTNNSVLINCSHDMFYLKLWNSWFVCLYCTIPFFRCCIIYCYCFSRTFKSCLNPHVMDWCFFTAHTPPVQFGSGVFIPWLCLLRSPVNPAGAVRIQACPGASLEARRCSSPCLSGIPTLNQLLLCNYSNSHPRHTAVTLILSHCMVL